jgi:prepilin-type N-terminal cleavage/methylation domain-containing protein
MFLHTGSVKEKGDPDLKTNAQNRSGFTLIELMIVVAIIAIVAAVAIPGLLGARKAASESAVISALRTVSTAQARYRLRFGTYATLATLTANLVIDDSFADAQRNGYVFAEPAAPTPYAWALAAGPVSPGVTGDRYFFVDESGVIRDRDGAPATVADTPID